MALYPIGVAHGAPPLACDDAAIGQESGCLYFADYEPGQCRRRPPVLPLICGRPRKPGSSYCPACHDSTHRPPTEAERDALRH